MTIKKIRKLPTVLSEDEIKKLFSVISSPRDLMLLQTIYYLGCRVNEAINIKKPDVRFKEGIVILRAETTKRKKERQQPIPNKFSKPLLQYCSMIGDDAILFPITKQRVWQIIKDYTKEAGIQKNVHPHTLRHTYATRIYEEKKDIRLVQELLGHENPSTTAIYMHLDSKAKKKGVDGVF